LTAAFAAPLFGSDEVREYIAGHLSDLGLDETDGLGSELVAELERRSVQSSLGLFGVGSLLFASSLVFVALTDAINVIWKVPVRSGFRNVIRRRITAFVMVAVTGAVLMASLAVTAVAGAAEAIIPADIGLLDDLAQLLSGLASWVSLAVALALLFRFLLPVRVPWSRALVAGTITSVLLVVGTTAVGWYLRNFGRASLTGAFGAVIVALSWVYYAAQILLGGVQLLKVLCYNRPELLGIGDRGPTPMPDSGSRIVRGVDDQ
jgi:membrane protein